MSDDFDRGGSLPAGPATRTNNSGAAILVSRLTKCLARWQRLGDEHLHQCETVAGHTPPHRCRNCQAIAVEPS